MLGPSSLCLDMWTKDSLDRASSTLYSELPHVDGAHCGSKEWVTMEEVLGHPEEWNHAGGFNCKMVHIKIFPTATVSIVMHQPS